MASGMFNTEGIKNNDWETMLEARRQFEEGDGEPLGAGPMFLVAGAAVLAVILVVMAIAVG